MRDETLREAKRTLREWFRDNSTDYIIRVLDECREGKFCYTDQCHCLLGNLRKFQYGVYLSPRERPAEYSCNILGNFADYRRQQDKVGSDTLRIKRLIPMLLAEIRRRHRVPTAPPVEVACE